MPMGTLQVLACLSSPLVSLQTSGLVLMVVATTTAPEAVAAVVVAAVKGGGTSPPMFPPLLPQGVSSARRLRLYLKVAVAAAPEAVAARAAAKVKAAVVADSPIEASSTKFESSVARFGWSESREARRRWNSIDGA